MEVTALCVRLWMDVLVLLLAQVNHSYFAQRAGAAFPRVRPDRLQFFEYETVSVNCEEFRGLTEWRVMKRLNRISPTGTYNWNSSAPSSTIYPAFKAHSGEYWCEDGDGNSSSALNITITVSGGGSAGDPDLVTYAIVEIKKKKKERVVSGGCTEPCSPDESVVYSSVHYRQLSSA
ncbi:hypothetical protein ABVT39_025612 [Epinephelus coioides]